MGVHYYSGNSQIRTFVNENHLDDRVVRDVDLMRAHAVGTAVSRPVITVAELFGRNIVDLRERRRRRKRERDLVHEGNHVIAGRCNCERATRNACNRYQSVTLKDAQSKIYHDETMNLRLRKYRDSQLAREKRRKKRNRNDRETRKRETVVLKYPIRFQHEPVSRYPYCRT